MSISQDPNLSILLVEDNVQDEALIIATLERENLAFSHRRVSNAENFRRMLSLHRWDLIISDYNLPAFSAEEVLQILREHKLDIPCIVISGYIGEEAAVSLMKAGAYDFVPKGNLSRLVPAIRREAVEVQIRREKRLIEYNLYHNEKLIAGIAEALGEGLLVTAPSGEIIFINPEASRLLGWDEQQLLGKDLQQTVQPLKTDGTAYDYQQCPILKLGHQGIPLRSESEIFVRRDGSTFHASYVATPIIENDKVSAVVTAFQDISSRKQAEQALRESRRRLRELSNFLQTVREEERTRIARELHDELGQALTALKMDVSWMASRFTEEQSELSIKADSMLTLIDSTVDSMRRIAANLRPGLLDDLGLAATVEWLLEEFQKRTGVRHELQMSHEEFDFESWLSTTVFRILQEAITNVARHAHASDIFVTLEDQGESVFLSVRDNGIGFDSSASDKNRKSFGLLGIRERVASLGGQFEIISQPGQGTEVRANLPKTFNPYSG